MIDTVFIIVGAICMLAGLIGCFLPIVPGPPITYAGILLLHISSRHDFSTNFLLLFAILTIIVTLLDYLIPLYGTKKLKGSTYGIWGSAVGMLIGLFFGPVGIIIGPVLGAFIGELISGNQPARSIKPALGSFLGFVAGTGIKIILSLVMTYHFVINLFPQNI